MSMILRLQHEKAEAQMEARQFRRFAEGKMAHDQYEIAELEELLFRREQAVQSLSCEIQAYKHRLVSYGLPPALGTDPPNTPSSSSAIPRMFDYPPLRCSTAVGVDLDFNEEDAASDLDKFPAGETPREQLQNLEQRICHLEQIPIGGHVVEKGVVEQSPRRLQNLHRLSVDSRSSFLIRETVRQEGSRGDEFPVMVDHPSEQGWRDDMSDRVYTIDAIHGVAGGTYDNYVGTPRDRNGNKKAADDIDEGEIKKLYMRLQVLEAGWESMRQTVMSMGTDKAQIVLLGEIAQQLCKDVKPEKNIVKKPSFIQSFSIMTAIKWVASLIFWRKKSTQCKYTFEFNRGNVGLLLLLEKSAGMMQRRYLTRTQG